MKDNLNYETYLFISSKKMIISVYSDSNNKIYEEELIFKDVDLKINFIKIDFFLEKNIFKIEKKIKKFVKKISIILDLDIFFSTEISIKKNNENLMDFKSLRYLLNEAKDYCQKTINEKKIIHMTIENYQIDNKDYSFLPKDTKCDSFSLDIKFLCISNDLNKDLETTLKKYQISIKQIVSANYIEKFLSNEEKDLFLMTKKIMNGYNPNEVFLIDKTTKNHGFFEKFFNFFN